MDHMVIWWMCSRDNASDHVGMGRAHSPGMWVAWGQCGGRGGSVGGMGAVVGMGGSSGRRGLYVGGVEGGCVGGTVRVQGRGGCGD